MSIRLLVQRDRKKRLILLAYPKNQVTLIFKKTATPHPLDKRLQAMWKKFDAWVDRSGHDDADDYSRQRRKIHRMVKEEFGVEIPGILKGWPCQVWVGNKTWINRYIRAHQK